MQDPTTPPGSPNLSDTAQTASDSTAQTASDSLSGTPGLEDFADPLKELTAELNSWWRTLLHNLPNLVLAILVLVIMYFISGYVKKGVRKLVNRFMDKPSIARLLTNMISGVMLILGLLLILIILDLDQTVTSILAGAGIAGLVLGLAFQDVIQNTFAGIMLAVNDNFNIGDYVEVADMDGHVEKIGIRFTHLKTFKGQLAIVPNKQILDGKIINYTVPGTRRIDVACGISYGDDLDKVERIVVEAIDNAIETIEGKKTEMFFTEFGGSSINFVVRFWVDDPEKHKWFESTHKAIKALKAAFDKEDIMIPFPIRTLDFGIRGGEKLNEVLSLRDMQSDSKEKNKEQSKDSSEEQKS